MSVLRKHFRPVLLGLLLGLAVVADSNANQLLADCSCKDDGEQEYQTCCYCDGCCMPVGLAQAQINNATWNESQKRYFCSLGVGCPYDDCGAK